MIIKKHALYLLITVFIVYNSIFPAEQAKEHEKTLPPQCTQRNRRYIDDQVIRSSDDWIKHYVPIVPALSSAWCVFYYQTYSSYKVVPDGQLNVVTAECKSCGYEPRFFYLTFNQTWDHVKTHTKTTWTREIAKEYNDKIVNNFLDARLGMLELCQHKNCNVAKFITAQDPNITAEKSEESDDLFYV